MPHSRPSLLRLHISQFIALVYKNFLLHVKDFRYLLLGVGLPILFALLVGMNNRTVELTTEKSMHWRDAPMNPLSRLKSTDFPTRNGDDRAIAYYRQQDQDIDIVKRVLRGVQSRSDFEIKWIDCDSQVEMQRLLSAWNVSGIVGAFVFDRLDTVKQDHSVTVLYNGTHTATLPKLLQVLYLSLDEIQDHNDNGIGSNGLTAGPTPEIYLQEFAKSMPGAEMFLRLAPFQLAFGITLLIPVLTVIVVDEKEKKQKHQLMVSGVSLVMYWASRAFSDWLLYFIVIGTQYVFVALFGGTEAYMKNNIFVVAILFIAFGFVMTNFSYLMSFLFQKQEDATRWMTAFVSVTVSLTFLVVTLLMGNQLTNVMAYVLSLVPTFSLYHGLLTLGSAIVEAQPITFWAFITLQPGFGRKIGITILIMMVEAVLFFVAVICIEAFQLFKKLPKQSCLSRDSSQRLYHEIYDDEFATGETEDEDVIHERDLVTESIQRGRTRSSDHGSYILQIDNVSKNFTERTWYGKVKKINHAVRGVTLGVRRGEVFSLLGPNGAGKTTMLSILNGLIGPSGGQVFIDGHNPFRSPFSVLRDVGVCPQEDYLYEKISVREHIRIYNGLRGMLFDKKEEDRIIRDFHLTEHAGKSSGSLSGGNKRKLSVALAFIGKPKLVLLDEPSTGMDGMAKRAVWKKIEESGRDCAMVLTTHSMEEADALSSRMAIMTNGSLRAVGTSEHLKQKYGSGFRLEITALLEHASKIREWVGRTFMGTRCLRSVGGNMTFEIPRHGPSPEDSRAENIPEGNLLDFAPSEPQEPTESQNATSEYSLPLIFEVVEKNKTQLHIDDYSVSQASLEQVFLTFARKQVA